MGFHMGIISYSGSGAIPSNPSFRRDLVTNHYSSGSASTTNFPVYVSLVDPTLRTVANGGHVESTSGYDIRFWSDSACTLTLLWETDYYNPTTGTFYGWVMIPTVSNTVDTVFYMTYGDAGILSFCGGSLWGSAGSGNYKFVLHGGSPVAISMIDSAGSNILTTTGTPTANTGKASGAIGFNGSTIWTKFNYTADFNLSSGDFALGYWFKYVNLTATNGMNPTPVSKGGYGQDFDWGFQFASNTSIIFYTAGSASNLTATVPAMSAGNWYHLYFSRVSGTNRIYFNGAEVATNSMAITNVNTTTVNIGVYSDNATKAGWFNGQLDEVKIINGNGLSADWILQEYNNQNVPGGLNNGIDDFGFIKSSMQYAIAGTPTYTSWSPTNKSMYITLSNNNLTATAWINGQYGIGIATLGKSSGKWYWEVTIVGAPTGSIEQTGIANFIPTGANTLLVGQTPGSVAYRGSPWGLSDNKTATFTTVDSAYGAQTAGQVLGIALDMCNNKIGFYLNGVFKNNILNLPVGTWYPACSSAAQTAAIITANFGQFAFKYAPPTGYHFGVYTPTVFSTLDPVNKFGTLALSNSNLTLTETNTSVSTVNSLLGKSSGKWYWEVTIVTVPQYPLCGVGTILAAPSGVGGFGNSNEGWGWRDNRFYHGSGTPISTGFSSYNSGDTLGFALDMEGGNLNCYKNGVSAGPTITGITGTIYPVLGTFGGTPGVRTCNFGGTAFLYTPPTGYSPGIFE